MRGGDKVEELGVGVAVVRGEKSSNFTSAQFWYYTYNLPAKGRTCVLLLLVFLVLENIDVDTN